jgi:hypothetical protein
MAQYLAKFDKVLPALALFAAQRRLWVHATPSAAKPSHPRHRRLDSGARRRRGTLAVLNDEHHISRWWYPRWGVGAPVGKLVDDQATTGNGVLRAEGYGIKEVHRRRDPFAPAAMMLRRVVLASVSSPRP